MKHVNKTIPYDLLDYYLAFKPEINILFDQYNFPYEYHCEDNMASMYEDDVKCVYAKIVKLMKLKDFTFQDIDIISTQKFRESMICILSIMLDSSEPYLFKIKHEIVPNIITGYRITGSNILPGNSTMMYRIDLFRQSPTTQALKLFTGLNGENVYTNVEENINLNFKSVRREDKVHKEPDKTE